MQTETTEKPPIYLDPNKASLYLEAKYGARCSKSTLAKWRVSGTGPAFRYLGPHVVYTPEDLDIFAQSRLSEKVHSTAGRRDPLRRRGRRRKPFALAESATL